MCEKSRFPNFLGSFRNNVYLCSVIKFKIFVRQ